MIGYRVSAHVPIGCFIAQGRRRGVTTDLLRKNVDSFYTTAPANTATAPESGGEAKSKKEESERELKRERRVLLFFIGAVRRFRSFRRE